MLCAVKPIDQKIKIAHRIVTLMTAALMIFSALMAVTYAWSDFSQHKTNIADGGDMGRTVTLHKYEKAPDGTVTSNVIPGAEFYLYKAGDSAAGVPDTQIGGRYITDSDGRITVTGVDSGNYYFLETDPSYGYTYDKDSGGSSIDRYDFTIGDSVAPDDVSVDVFAYNTRLQGSLIVAKTAVNADNSPLTQGQLETEFKFTVSFSDNGTYAYKLDGTGGDISLASGGTLTLKTGHTAVFDTIPVGVQYTVTETPVAHYVSQSINHQGTITKDGVIARFTNIYSDETPPGPRTTSLTVKKVVDNEVSYNETDRIFHFALNIDGQPARTFDLKAGDSKAFTDLPVGANYSVTETNPATNGYSLTKVENGAGALTADPITATFTNHFVNPVIEQINGEKTWDLNGKKPVLPDAVTVDLMNGDTVVGTTVVKPDREGKWTYTFDAPKYNNDGKEIAYTVSENPIDSWTATADGYNIKNTYIPPVMIDSPVVKKVITGDTPASAANFQFALTAQGNAPLPDGSLNGVKMLSIIGAGEQDFGFITYTKPGAYVYKISEINTGETGYAYDAAVFTLTVVVAEKDNTLAVASKTLVKGGRNSDKAVFTNTYDKTKTGGRKVTISGTKSWDHRNDPKVNWPKSIIVTIYADRQPCVITTVDASSGWQYAFNLPKFGGDGHEIRYTVNEAPVKDYVKVINGFNITNIFTPHGGDQTNPGNPRGTGNVPQTGDNSNIWLWLSIMIASVFALIAMAIIGRKNKYKPKHLHVRE